MEECMGVDESKGLGLCVFFRERKRLNFSPTGIICEIMVSKSFGKENEKKLSPVKLWYPGWDLNPTPAGDV